MLLELRVLHLLLFLILLVLEVREISLDREKLQLFLILLEIINAFYCLISFLLLIRIKEGALLLNLFHFLIMIRIIVNFIVNFIIMVKVRSLLPFYLRILAFHLINLEMIMLSLHLQINLRLL